MLLHRGDILPSALRQARLTREEIRAAVRAAGLACLVDAEAVALETEGSFSVIRRVEGGSLSSLDGVRTPRTDGTGDSFGRIGRR